MLLRWIVDEFVGTAWVRCETGSMRLMTLMVFGGTHRLVSYLG